jgi:hypothetical protein
LESVRFNQVVVFGRRKKSHVRGEPSPGSIFASTSSLEFNVRIGIPAPAHKRRVRTWQLRTPEIVGVVGIFHGANGPWMTAHVDEDGIKPTLSEDAGTAAFKFPMEYVLRKF